MVEFRLICPTDGSVDLGLEDISAVVFHGADSVDVVFECPHCSASLRAELRVPNLLGAAIELAQYAEDASEQSIEMPSRTPEGIETLFTVPAEDDRAERAERERDGEAYCEYFRRQLATIETAEDLLREFE